MRIRDILPLNVSNGLRKDIIEKLLKAHFKTVEELTDLGISDLREKADLNAVDAINVFNYVEKYNEFINSGYYAYSYATECKCPRCEGKLRTSDTVGASFFCYDCDETFSADEVDMNGCEIIIPLSGEKDEDEQLKALCKLYVEGDCIHGYYEEESVIHMTFREGTPTDKDIKNIIYGLNQDSVSPNNRDGFTPDMIEF